MIKFENTEVVGWEHAIRGMRNPLNSWDKSDSKFDEYDKTFNIIGENDHNLMMRLSSAGNDHAKFLRKIVIYADIVAPIYWWKEFDTYKVGTVANSCSTMHRIHSKEFTTDDFSCEHLDGLWMQTLKNTIELLNDARAEFNNTKDKQWWWKMIQLLPSSYNQRRTVMLNYQVVKNMYHARKNHKLDEWHDFCAWVESLPYSELITGD